MMNEIPTEQNSSEQEDEVRRNKEAATLPQDRAGVQQGAKAETVFKYESDKHISITETVLNKQAKKQLYVADSRKNPSTGKSEYRLKETKGDTETYYRNGHWFPEREVRLA